MRRIILVGSFILLWMSYIDSPRISFAWDGYDYEKGDYIEIEKGNLVREDETIEIYDYSDNEYKDVEVESIEKSGNSVEIEVYDYDTDEYRTFEMEDN